MGITNSNKEINLSQIDCDGTLKVTLALSAAPDISANPADIVLVLDRSGSMAGSPLENMKAGADTFIDIIDEATDGAGDGTIGSGSRIGIDVSVLNDWATDPDASHVAVTPDDADLEDLFTDLAANISRPDATSIVINETVNPDFTIVSVGLPTKGTATVLSQTSLRWEIPALGVAGNEGASLAFYIRHTALSAGTKLVNQSITYEDTEQNAVTFPDPSVEVSCGIIVDPEPCPEPADIAFESCQDSLTVDLGDTWLESQGRILQLDVTVKIVCPGKRVALGIILTETDTNGQEHSRGMKAITIPAHYAPTCRDVTVKCVRFVLPEDLNVSGGCPDSLCSQGQKEEDEYRVEHVDKRDAGDRRLTGVAHHEGVCHPLQHLQELLQKKGQDQYLQVPVGEKLSLFRKAGLWFCYLHQKLFQSISPRPPL